LPHWASFRGEFSESKTWIDLGHRLVVPTFDSRGIWRGLRALRIVQADDGVPKRLPPSGKRSAGLLLANEAAVRMLRGEEIPNRLVVTEGEPDWLTWSVQTDLPVIGVLSGSWTDEVAARVPADCDVVLRTHHDDAGDRYASVIADSLKKRCRVWKAA
jgi:hypothetical protein